MGGNREIAEKKLRGKIEEKFLKLEENQEIGVSRIDSWIFF